MRTLLCVHIVSPCSAGVGRTGTLITIYSMIKMIEDVEEVDVFNYVLKMRSQRTYMVQTEVGGEGWGVCCHIVAETLGFIVECTQSCTVCMQTYPAAAPSKPPTPAPPLAPPPTAPPLAPPAPLLLPHPLLPPQKQYVFIHDALLKYLNIRGHEMPVKVLRKRYQALKEENPETGQNGIIAEFAVSVGHACIWTHMHIRTYYIHTYTYIRTYMHTHAWTMLICGGLSGRVCSECGERIHTAHTHTHMYVCTHVRMYVCTYICTYTCTNYTNYLWWIYI